jgi:large subunit ribosomal protein L54
MICHRCLYRASALRIRPSFTHSLTTSAAAPSPSSPPATASTSAAQPFSTPLSPAPNATSLGVHLRPKPKIPLPISIAPAGTALKGLNFLKGREDPVALPEEEYPEWLWHCLDAGKKGGDEGVESTGDEFCKSLLSILYFLYL